MYDVVAGRQVLKPSYILSKTKALELFPMLKKDKLVGALVYYDGMFFCFAWTLKLNPSVTNIEIVGMWIRMEILSSISMKDI